MCSFNNLSNPLQGNIRSEADLKVGQDLTLLAAGSIQTQNIDTSNNNGGDGGSITLIAGDDITARDLYTSSSLVNSGNFSQSGNGGNIAITSLSGNISIQFLNSSSFSDVFLTSAGNSQSGNGGDITHHNY